MERQGRTNTVGSGESFGLVNLIDFYERRSCHQRGERDEGVCRRGSQQHKVKWWHDLARACFVGGNGPRSIERGAVLNRCTDF